MKQTQFAEDLREALGAESAGKWLEFMDRIESSLPFLLGSAGRPTKEQIDSSVIGSAGFDSWTKMIEASPAWGGLGWSVDSWKAWKRAFAVVQDHAYLRDLGLSASEINTLAKEFKPFPPTREDFEAAKAARKDQLEAKRGNSVASLKAQLTDYQGKVSILEAKLEDLQNGFDDAYHNWKHEERGHKALNDEYQQTKGLLVAAKEKVSALEKDAQEAEKKLASQSGEIKKLTRQVKQYRSMSWLDHLKAVFGG